MWTCYPLETIPFYKLIAQIIRLKANFPDNRIQSIRMDNAGEFRSKDFDDYCLAMGIKLEHSVPHVHTQNGLAESLIKRIKWIARPLLQNCKLPTCCWGHAVLHAAALIQLRPTDIMKHPPYSWCVGKNQVFPICIYLAVRCTCQYQHLSVHQWDPTESWGSMLVMRLHP